MTPFVPSTSPGGRAPATTLHATGVIPPLDCRVALYAVPRRASGNRPAGVVMSRGAATRILNDCVAVCWGLLESCTCTVKAKLPVAEMIGWSNDLRSATEGRGNFFVLDQSFEKLPEELQPKIIGQIRSRKGLKGTEEENAE